MKLCSKCKIKKDLVEFYKDKTGRDGYCSYCKECSKKKPVDKEKAAARHQKWKNSEKGKEYFKKYYQDNKEVYAERNKEWFSNNKDRYKELWRKYANSEKGKKRHKHQEAKRRAQKIKAALPEFDEEIKEIYKNCPEGCHVDHIYPLNHPNLCGLHVPWNLQYLTAKENIRKSNKLPEEYCNG